MKKLILLSLFSLFFFSQSSDAQWGSCDPDLTYADSIFGVYPPPLSANNPDGGIPITACVDADFYFVWTLKVPEIVDVTVSGFNLSVSVDSIVVETSGAITDLPAGMTYAMNPQDGVFTPADSLACITLYGTPETAGTYDLKINLTIFSGDLLIVGGSFAFELPNADFPAADGNYFLTVEDAGGTDCFTDTDEILAASFSVRNLPNPFMDFTNIEITANHADDLNFRVFDIIGNEIHRERLQVIEGLNNFQFDGSQLSNGIYTYTIEKDGALISNRMVINR